MNATTDGARMMTEEIQVAGNELLTRVKDLLMEGRVRHIRVKAPSGETYFEVPLAVGVLGGAALSFASPFLAMAGALAGLVSNVKLEVVRDTDAVDAMEAGVAAAASAAKKVATTAKKAVVTAKRTATGAVKGAAASAKRIAAKPPARAVAAAKRAVTKSAKPAKKAAKPAKAGRGKAKSKGRG